MMKNKFMKNMESPRENRDLTPAQFWLPIKTAWNKIVIKVIIITAQVIKVVYSLNTDSFLISGFIIGQY